MDPDHPLAALVRKAQQEKNGNLAVPPKPEEEAVAQAPPAEYTTDRKYFFKCISLCEDTYTWCMLETPLSINR